MKDFNEFRNSMITINLYEKNTTLGKTIENLNTKIQPLEIRKISDDEFIFER